MPVFFYVDPEFATDPRMAGITTLTLSYTFFRVGEEEEEGGVEGGPLGQQQALVGGGAAAVQ
jgi:cytochrome c oxidase assembly protein Cox11